MLMVHPKEWLFNLLSKQKTFTVLSFHGHEIITAFLLFTITSWLSYYFLAPYLIRYSQKKQVRDEASARLKWGHMIVSFLHAVIVSAWSLKLSYSTQLGATTETRVLGYSADFGFLFSFSMGYFLWDVFCCIWHVRQYGLGFLVHSVMGLTGLTCCYGPFMMYPISRFLLFEISTIFLDIHWFLEKLDLGGGKLILINDIVALVAYLGVRIIFGSYLTFKFLVDLFWMWSQVPLLFSTISLAGNCTTHVLNFYWFYKLGRSAIRAINRHSSNHGHAKSISQPRNSPRRGVRVRRSQSDKDN